MGKYPLIMGIGNTSKAPSDLKAPKQVAGSQSVYIAIAVLRGAARQNENGVTAKKLSQELGPTLHTTHRLLQVFVDVVLRDKVIRSNLSKYDSYFDMSQADMELAVSKRRKPAFLSMMGGSKTAFALSGLSSARRRTRPFFQFQSQHPPNV